MATKRDKQYLKMLEEGLEMNLDRLQNYSYPAADIVKWRGDGPLPTKLRSKDLDELVDDIANNEDDSLNTDKPKNLDEDSEFERIWRDSDTLFEEVGDEVGDMDDRDEEDEDEALEDDLEDVVEAEDDVNDEEDDELDEDEDEDFEVEDDDDEVEDVENVTEEDVLDELSKEYDDVNLGFISESPLSLLEDSDESYEISQLIKETELLEDDLDSSFMFGNYLKEDDHVEEEVVVSDKKEDDDDEDYEDLDEDDYEEVEVDSEDDLDEDEDDDEEKEVNGDVYPDDMDDDD